LADKGRVRRAGLFSAALLAFAFAPSFGLLAQDQFARAYVEGETAYQNGDLATAEQRFLDSLKSADAPKNRGSKVHLVSQQYGYFPEAYLALIYSDQQNRCIDVLKYAALAKKYVKGGDPFYLTLRNAESRAKDCNNGSTPPPPGGPMFALVIGIDHYDDRAFPTLKTAVSDARAVSALLSEQYGFDTKLLVDATRRDIITALDGYRKSAGVSANLLIYYAGHGYYDKGVDEKAFWLPKDAEASNTANWIRADDVTATIKAIPAWHIVVIADSCYSGGFRLAKPDFTESDHNQYIDRIGRRKSRNLLSSGALEPVADGGGGADHSVFAAALLRGLTAIDAGKFTASELFRDYIAVSVTGNSDQSPQYVPLGGDDGGDFVFVRKSASPR
jgi:hypothetical protein